MSSEMSLSRQTQLSQRLARLARQKPEYDNLRFIAISNLRTENERTLRAWWHRKYQIPPKPIDDYTFEELLIEYFEDFYFENPDKAEEFFKAERRVDEEVDDFEIPSHVAAMLRKRKNKIDISKYQTEGDENLTDDQCKAILDSIRGFTQIKPKIKSQKDNDDGEIDDDFTI